MSEEEKSDAAKGCLGFLSLVGFGLAALWFWHSCSTPKIQSAVHLEEKGEYDLAYQEYAKLLVKASQKFELSKPEDDLKKWVESLARDYVSFKSQQPGKSDCRSAYSKLRVLENQLNSLEHRFLLQNTIGLEKSKFLEFWQERFYGNQKTMPNDAIKIAEQAFANHFSMVFLKG
jgi:hypothetical protein